MTLWKTEHRVSPRHTARRVASPAGYPDYAVLAVVVAAPPVLLLWLVPLPFVLPALSIVSFAIAGLVALVARHAGTDRRAPGLTAWDISALFTAIWIVAGLMSGVRPLTELFDRLAMSP
jgi:hypothetical protein